VRGLAIGLLVLIGAAGIEALQPSLCSTARNTKLREDVTLVPPAANVRTLSLGQHAVAADLLWAKLLLEYGTHWQEKRPFPDITRYIDAILALDESFAPLFRYVDTLLIYRPPVGTEEDARTARAYLERGLRARPFDAELWLKYGQFLAFTAPSFMSNAAEIDTWRKEGAFAMARAVDYGADVGMSMSAASLLGRAGETKATIEFLERAYALTDDLAERKQIELKLAELQKQRAFDEGRVEATRATSVVESGWQATYPFLTRGEFLLVGPTRDPAACAGVDRAASATCATRWADKINAR